MDLVQIKLAGLGKAQCFGQPFENTGNRDLVAHLCCLSGASPSDMNDPPGISIHDQFGRREGFLAAAAHDR